DGGLENALSRLMESFARILAAIDLARQAQAIEVALCETAIAGRAALDRRQQAAIHIATHGIGMDANGFGQIGRTQIVHAGQSLCFCSRLACPFCSLYHNNSSAC